MTTMKKAQWSTNGGTCLQKEIPITLLGSALVRIIKRGNGPYARDQRAPALCSKDEDEIFEAVERDIINAFAGEERPRLLAWKVSLPEGVELLNGTRLSYRSQTNSIYDWHYDGGQHIVELKIL